MLIKALNSDYIPQWLELAKEMESIFQAPMAKDKNFLDFIRSKIKKKEVFMALDRMNPDNIMGIIAFSKSKNCISWFGVFEKYRRRGIGTRLGIQLVKKKLIFHCICPLTV